MAPDMEMRTSNAIGAMDALTQLVEAQMPGCALPSDQLAPLLRVVFGAVKRALPSGFRPLGANDDEGDE